MRSKENICVRAILLVTTPWRTARRTVRVDATIPQAVWPGHLGYQTVTAGCQPRHSAVELMKITYGDQESVKNLIQVILCWLQFIPVSSPSVFIRLSFRF